MSGIVHQFDPADRFVAGTVGQPGERSFYLQARSGNRIISVLIEKDQVSALAARLALLLRELRRNDPTFHIVSMTRDDEPLESPITEEFRVGAISLSWLSDRELVAIDFHSVDESESDQQTIEEVEASESTDLLRVILTPAQTELFIGRANAVVGAGRPPCPLCGLALDPRGHLCPRANGYRR